ncbi:DUF4263 domain-containing protein [Robiginitalea sp. M366]|uniref:Shedu anti-phage system protein SduA domain-containing protein n=1 Tax=Robiginitalea aestuariiviva TaxID=3036903 RepID=UPI00240D2571|nr:Shedu anti-phage system protein SduA domain-containing protein [Robiginitalea aestuariiviva]MDG1573316.1 DUF4263 domain-containing protein [Robiginitalea aestuariiviva]
MPRTIQKVRKIQKGNYTYVYYKNFDLTEKGMGLANAYEKNTSTRKLRTETLGCKIDKTNKKISIFPPSGFPIDEIKVIGTSSLSKIKGIYNTTGLFYKGFGDIIESIINQFENLESFTLDYRKSAKSSIATRNGNYYLTLSQKDYNYSNGLFVAEKQVSTQNSKSEIFRYLKKKLPELTVDDAVTSKIVSKEFRNLIFQETIDELSDKEAHDLMFQLYEKYLSESETKIDIFKQTDTYKLEYILKEYEEHLSKHNKDELKWQDFLETNFHLIFPGYKYVIREVDTIFEAIDLEAESRPVDFIAIDIYNNVELIEIKTPNANVISTNKDHNNYYLLNNCSKACVQLEKYLMCIENNKEKVEKLIRRKIGNKYGVLQKDINLLITKPKARLIIGEIKSILRNKSRHEDLQLQRHSFKNIEIVMFDEILNSLIEINNELKSKRKTR